RLKNRSLDSEVLATFIQLKSVRTDFSLCQITVTWESRGMKIQLWFALFLLILVAGCASPNGIDDKEGRLKAGESTKISLGMTKLEVMRALGKPETISADTNGETLYYRL